MSERLTKSEVATLLALYVLGGTGTAKEVADVSGMNVQVVRNAFTKLKEKGLVRKLKAVGGALLIPVMASVRGGREVPYELVVKDLDTILREYRDSIVDWMEDLGIKSIEELKELLEKRKKELEEARKEKLRS